MFRKILVLLDGTSRSEAILPYVRDLAQKYGSEVVLLQVVPFEDEAADAEPRAPEETGYLDRVCGYFEKCKPAARPRTEYGDVVPTAMDVIRKETPDLVALASHGRTAFGQMLRGSVATTLLHELALPLLVIHSEGE